MARIPPMPNAENCSEEQLLVAANASPRKGGFVRMWSVRCLILGMKHADVAKLADVALATLYGWVHDFNESGIDGLIEKPRSGRPRRIPSHLDSHLTEIIEKPDQVGVTHWTGVKFHGYLREQLDLEVGYRTVIRWLQGNHFRLKVPQPWSDRQDEIARNSFQNQLKTWLAVLVEALQMRRVLGPPFVEDVIDICLEGREFNVAEDSDLYFDDRQSKLVVARTARALEENLANVWQLLPVSGQGVYVAGGDAATQMAVDVLNVFGVGAVDVTREVEVVIVLRASDLLPGHHAGVARRINLLVEGVYNAVDVLLAEAVFVAVLDEVFGGVDHEDALAGLGVLFVEDNDASGDACAVKQVGGEADDTFQVARPNELLANDSLGIASEKHAVRQNTRGLPAAIHGANDV